MAWLMAALAAALVVTTACGPPARSPAPSISNGIAVDVTELSHIYTEDMPILGWSNGQTSLGRLMVLGEAPPPDLCGQPPSMVGAEAVALGIGSWQEDVGFCPQVDVSIWRTRPGTVYLDYVFTSTCLP